MPTMTPRELPESGEAESRPRYGAEARSLWPLDPAVIYLNHGGFGVTPHEVLAVQAGWRERIERNPTRFFTVEMPPALREAAAVLAAYMGARGEDLALVENATGGCNAVLRSLNFSPGDEILVTNLGYPAINNAAAYAAQRAGACVVTVEIDLPVRSEKTLLDAIAGRLSRRTRLTVFDHVASRSALVLPIAALTRLAHEAGAAVLVDGAHAPGMVALDLPGIGADWFVGNCHKWLMAPRSCGFLWASPSAPQPVHPTSISLGYGGGFVAEFDWTGTRDPSAALSVPAAIRFHQKIGGAALMARNVELAGQAARHLAKAWGTELAAPAEAFAAMAAVKVSSVLPATTKSAAQLRRWLSEVHRIEAEVFAHSGALWVRIAAQAYNEPSDYERLAFAVPAYR